jgi:hypothetical protein
MDRKMK